MKVGTYDKHDFTGVDGKELAEGLTRRLGINVMCTVNDDGSMMVAFEEDMQTDIYSLSTYHLVHTTVQLGYLLDGFELAQGLRKQAEEYRKKGIR